MDSGSLFLIILMLVGIFVAKAFMGALGGTNALNARQRYRGIEGKPLLTAAEVRALTQMESLLPEFRILAQVSMGALLKTKKNVDPKDKMRLRGYYSQKIVDFVLLDRATNKVVAIVELDDYSHDSKKDKIRDILTSMGGYKTIRLPNPKPDTIVNTLLPAIRALEAPIGQV